MARDAAKATIKLNEAYGYSINHNGSWHSVIGIASSINEETGKVTLRSCYESSGSNGKLGDFREVDRKRTVFGSAVFHISMEEYNNAIGK